jgi:CBS domain containing-hemolysin-like protein
MMSKGPYDDENDAKEGEYAKKLIFIRKKGLQLLVTILLGCAITNSAISILLAEAEGDVTGFLVSTVLTLICGEIVP